MENLDSPSPPNQGWENGAFLPFARLHPAYCSLRNEMERKSMFLLHPRFLVDVFSFVLQRIFISQTTNFHFTNYKFSFRKLQISISQTTDFHFAKYRFPFRFVPFRFVPFRFANYSKPFRCPFNCKCGHELFIMLYKVQSSS